MVKNPYYEIVCKFFLREKIVYMPEYELRGKYIEEFSFAIPDEEALKEIAKFSPIIEIGPGMGYWAYCLKQIGVEIVCVDNGDRDYLYKKWVEPITGDEKILDAYPGHTLFLCWPPYNEPMAANCLRAYKGDYFIYIGEGKGGCTGDDDFFDILEKRWVAEKTINIPTWFGINDYLCIYKKA